MARLALDTVTKRYASVTAVDSLSFTVKAGRIFGLLGPNGAGKTSTLRMITCITMPDSGSITLDSLAVSPYLQSRMGYLPEERGLYRRMKVGEQLVYLGMLKGMNRIDAHIAARTWLLRFGAESWFGRRTDQLSKGMQQKVQFIATVAHNPDLLIFDEPFSGLDPINADMLREAIFEFRRLGKTILFASHRMEQVEQMCDDICLIADGKALISGPLRDIKRSFGRKTLRLSFEGSDAFLDRYAGRPGYDFTRRTPGTAEIRLSDPSNAPFILRDALEQTTVYRYELVEPSLNDIFIRSIESNRLSTAKKRRS